ncbi:hypothetical protein LJR084_005396 [Variovorax sp. LjRoot84]|uniref:hypothetical protein n=1 Tax=Variovorax sp. LjRoot84 TaxID=3342340 RepID=UPI003ECF77D2
MGRKPLTDAQTQAVDDRISATMRQLARTNPEWQAKSRDDRVMAASQQAMADIQAEAARKVENTQRQILKPAATEARIAELTASREKLAAALQVLQDNPPPADDGTKKSKRAIKDWALDIASFEKLIAQIDATLPCPTDAAPDSAAGDAASWVQRGINIASIPKG